MITIIIISNFFVVEGVGEPRASVTGRELPAARLVSTLTHKDLGFHDHAVTVYLPAWGQLIDHDMAMGSESKGTTWLSWLTRRPPLSLENRFSLSESFSTDDSQNDWHIPNIA